MKQNMPNNSEHYLLDDIGEDLTYTSVYDDIRNARYEEDSQLSQGIWEHDIAHADWNKVKTLCVNALKNQSKDLQIASWLVEALTMLDGLDGVATGIDLLTKFIDKYWEKCYPHAEDESSDLEQKIRILEWLYDTIHQRVILLPIVDFSLYNYEYARNLRTTVLQNPTQSNSLLETAKKSNIKTIEEINNIIENAEQSICTNILKQTNLIIYNINEFSKILLKKRIMKHSFTQLQNDINTIQQLLKNKCTESKVDEGNIPETQTSKVEPRESLYFKLNDLAEQLEQFDKHSPAPHLLKLVVSWKDKNLLEIMNDLQQGETSAHLLLRRLLS